MNVHVKKTVAKIVPISASNAAFLSVMVGVYSGWITTENRIATGARSSGKTKLAVPEMCHFGLDETSLNCTSRGVLVGVNCGNHCDPVISKSAPHDSKSAGT
jgi:hypothetical protein